MCRKSFLENFQCYLLFQISHHHIKNHGSYSLINFFLKPPFIHASLLLIYIQVVLWLINIFNSRYWHKCQCIHVLIGYNSPTGSFHIVGCTLLSVSHSTRCAYVCLVLVIQARFRGHEAPLPLPRRGYQMLVSHGSSQLEGSMAYIAAGQMGRLNKVQQLTCKYSSDQRWLCLVFDSSLVSVWKPASPADEMTLLGLCFG